MRIILDYKIYPLEAILNSCFEFIDIGYFFLDRDSTGKKIIIKIKPKKSDKVFSRDDFFNSLLHNALRHQVTKNNKKISEYILGATLASVSNNLLTTLPPEGKTADYQEDPLGIAIPWEEKYGSKAKKSKSKV